MTEVKRQELNPVKQNTEAQAVQKSKKIRFAAVLKNPTVQTSLIGTLGDAMRAKTFTAALISAVDTNRQLMSCEPMSIISAALLGESLRLSPSPQLGHYYMVPFNDSKSGTTKATFQLGWKGYYQLALRSGQYKHLDAVAVKEGELIAYNPITDEIQLEPIGDPLAREKAKTIGYYAHFELNNGFTKAMYWPKEKMEAHALTYSQGYKAKKGYTFWEKDFDSMALKTMYRQLISKYGIMSIEMQKAFVNDMTIQGDINAASDEGGEPIFFDNAEAIDAETGEIRN